MIGQVTHLIPLPGALYRISEGDERHPRRRITVAMIYGYAHDVTGSIRPGETVLSLGEVADPFSLILWRGAGWWVHSAFLEVVGEQLQQGGSREDPNAVGSEG